MAVDGKEVVAGAGDIVIIGAETPHRSLPSATNG
jgi:mannose-6-phosphate isomerase-like protein (cupin superfamily)